MDWKPVDFIVGMMAIFMSVTLACAVIAPILTHQTLSPEKAKMVAGAAGFINSMIATYIGAQITMSRRKKDED